MNCCSKRPSRRIPVPTVEEEYSEKDKNTSIPIEETEDEYDDDDETTDVNDSEGKFATRVLLVGDAHIGKYELYDNLQVLAEEENVISTQGWISIPIRSQSYLLFSHIEGLEEDPRLRQWKYKNIDIFLLFFSLTNLESLYSVAYKWGPEILEVMEHKEKNQVQSCLGLIGLIGDRSNLNMIPEPVITSLKSMFSPDFYFEMSKNCSMEAMSELIILLEEKMYEDFVILNTTDDECTEDEMSACCSTHGLPEEDVESLAPGPSMQKAPSIEDNRIFNQNLSVVYRPRQEDLVEKLVNLRAVGVGEMINAEGSIEKEQCNVLIEQIQDILKYDPAKESNLVSEQDRTSKFFNSNQLRSHSEQSLLYKKQILGQIMPETSWNVSLWNKKKFKTFISQNCPLDDKDEVRQRMKEGFQQLTAANHCHSPSIPKKYLKEFENIILQCIIALSDEPTLTSIKLADFYLLCQFNLVNCLEYLIYRYPKGFGYLMMSYSRLSCRSPHPINLLEDESFVLKVMKIYHPKLYSTHRDRNGYNFLHYCGDRNFMEAVYLYINFDLSDSLSPFGRDENSSSPIAVAAQSGNEEIAKMMFDYLNINFKNDEFIAYMNNNDFKSTSLLGICAQQKLHRLLKDIIKSYFDRQLVNELIPLLVKKNSSDGDRTLLQSIQCESILSKLIPLCLKDNPRNLLLECKKKNHLGHYMAERNFSVVLQTIHEYCSTHDLKDLFFFEFIFAPNKYGDDCLKLAAWKGSNEFLVTALSACRGLNQSYLSLLLHGENRNQENLMELLLFQQRSLLVPRQIIMLMEKEVHTADKVKILSCYREHISPSEELVSLIQDTEKLLPLSTSQKMTIIMKKTIFLMLSISLFLLDVGFDISLAVRYYNGTDTACKINFYDYDGGNETNFDRAQRYIGALCFSTRFYITLLFILSPWLFYAFEFLSETFINLRPMYIVHVPYKEIKIPSYRSAETSAKALQAKIDQFEDKRLKWNPACFYSCKNILENMAFILVFIFEFILTILFWPIISMFQSFHAEVMYEIQHGLHKVKAREYKDKATKICSRARLIEALLESSFQPILQLYLVLPILVDNIISDKPRELTHNVYLEVVQFGSAITSIASISWAITAYQAGSKGGAMDLTVNFLGRFLLLMSNLFTITGRLLLFVVFAYGFGAGRLVGLISFILIHILFATLLIHYWRNPKDVIPSKVTYFVNCLINGFGNCYLHMWILLPQNVISSAKSGKSTFVRQLIFETLFFTELCAMVIFVFIMLDNQVAQAIQLDFLILSIVGFYFLGISSRLIYYETQHLWSGLISIQSEIKNLCKRYSKKKTS